MIAVGCNSNCGSAFGATIVVQNGCNPNCGTAGFSASFSASGCDEGCASIFVLSGEEMKPVSICKMIYSSLFGSRYRRHRTDGTTDALSRKHFGK